MSHPVNLFWRMLAFLLDLLIVGSPIALLCVAGSFGSEATHRQPDPAYLIAAGIASCYAIAEAMWGITPGLLIIGARIMATADNNDLKRRSLRWATKYGPFVFTWVLAVAASFSLSESLAPLVAIAMLVIWLSAGVFMLVSVAKHLLSGGRSQLYFDDLAKTELLFVRRRKHESTEAPVRL